MNEWMIEHITHFVTWYSIYEDLPEKLSRAQDQENLVSAAILELAFSLASCLFKNQFIATSGAQRTPMQKRAFTKSSLYSYPHSPVSAGAPGTGAAHHQSSSGVLRWASHTAFSALCPLFGLLTGFSANFANSFRLSGIWFLPPTSFFLWSHSCLNSQCLWYPPMKTPFITSKGHSWTLLPLGNENCIIYSVSLFSFAARKLWAMFYAQHLYSAGVSRYNVFTPLHLLTPFTFNLEFLFLYVCSIYLRLPRSK